MKTYSQFYINGEWTDPAEPGRNFTLINPATEQPFAAIALGSEEDVNRAVRAARAAFPAFSATTKQQRVAWLRKIQELILAREDELMAAASDEMGAPLTAVAHVRAAAENFRQMAETLDQYEFEKVETPNIVCREPIVVCHLVVSWP